MGRVLKGYILLKFVLKLAVFVSKANLTASIVLF